MSSKNFWRKSVRNSLKRLSGFAQRSSHEDTLSNEIVRFQGVSLKVLLEIRQGILDGSEAPGITLFILKEDVENVSAGRTVQFAGRKGLEPGRVMIRVPFRESRLEVSEQVLIPKERKDWSIEDVCEFVVLPNTLQDDSLYLDCIGEAAVGKPFEGAFVSQARKSSFGGLVDALSKHFEGQDPKSVFLWIDIFCANQPLLTRTDRGLNDTVQKERWTLLNSGLHKAIEHFDQRLIFFNSWDNPAPLQRAWCIWEIYGATKCGKEVQVVFDPQESGDVIKKLLKDSKSLLTALSSMDPRKMDCHDKKDLEMIRTAVEKLPGGFSALKASITARLRTWLLLTVENAVKAAIQVGEEDKGFGDLLVQAANFMDDLGEVQVALTYYWRAKDVYTVLFGTENHQSIALVYNNVAIVYKKQAKYGKALEMHEKALEIKKETVGEEHLSTAHTYNNMASVYHSQGEFQRALELLEKVLAIRKKIHGEAHVSLAETYNNLGETNRALDKPDEAQEMFQLALDIMKKTVGERHPGVAAVLHNLALSNKDKGNLKVALQQAQESYEIWKETLGPQSEQSANSLARVGDVLATMGKVDEGLQRIQEALAVLQSLLGQDHPSVAPIHQLVGVVLGKKGKLVEAAEQFEKALVISNERLGENHTTTADILHDYGILCEQRGKTEDAFKYFEAAYNIRKEKLGLEHSLTKESFKCMTKKKNKKKLIFW